MPDCSNVPLLTDNLPRFRISARMIALRKLTLLALGLGAATTALAQSTVDKVQCTPGLTCPPLIPTVPTARPFACATIERESNMHAFSRSATHMTFFLRGRLSRSVAPNRWGCHFCGVRSARQRISKFSSAAPAPTHPSTKPDFLSHQAAFDFEPSTPGDFFGQGICFEDSEVVISGTTVCTDPEALLIYFYDGPAPSLLPRQKEETRRRLLLARDTSICPDGLTACRVQNSDNGFEVSLPRRTSLSHAAHWAPRIPVPRHDLRA